MRDALCLELDRLPSEARLEYEISTRLGRSRAVFFWRRTEGGGACAELDASGRLLLFKQYQFSSRAFRDATGALRQREETFDGKARSWRLRDERSIAAAEAPFALALAAERGEPEVTASILAGSKTYGAAARFARRDFLEAAVSIHDANGEAERGRAFARWNGLRFPSEIAFTIPLFGPVRAVLAASS